MPRREECPACHAIIQPIWVHGHLQCPTCKTVIVPCCNGETAEAPPPPDRPDSSRDR